MKKLLYLLFIFVGMSSCVTHTELLNFNEGGPLPTGPVDIANLPQLRIQPDDLLSIRVKALDLDAVEPFNVDPPMVGNINLNGTTRPLIGYLVDREGIINFPVIGETALGGMTTTEARVYLEEKLEPYVVDPAIAVRILNFRVTVLGEVARPNTFFVANERMTILDALGLAGDITSYGNRTNVLVIREQDGERQMNRLNLQDNRIFTSPFFYLQQNDVVYVEPLPVKTASIRDQSQRILPWLSAITALTTLALTLSTL